MLFNSLLQRFANCAVSVSERPLRLLSVCLVRFPLFKEDDLIEGDPKILNGLSFRFCVSPRDGLLIILKKQIRPDTKSDKKQLDFEKSRLLTFVVPIFF